MSCRRCLITLASVLFIFFNAKICTGVTPEQHAKLTRKGHVYWASSSSIFANNLNSAKGPRQHLIHIANHFEQAYKAIRNQHGHATVSQVCNPRLKQQSSWINAARKYLNNLDKGTLDASCPYSLGSAGKKGEELMQHMLDLGVGLHTIGAGIEKDAFANWSRVVGDLRMRYENQVHTCDITRAGASRVGAKWYVQTVLTNAPITSNLAVWKRQYLSELVTHDPKGTLQSLQIPAVKKEGGTEVFLSNTTTVISSWGGAPETSLYTSLPSALNPALRDAIENNEKERDVVEDTTTMSNIAIMALPLLLTCVPISLIEHVSSVFMFLYIVVTDIVSALPLAIKGFELIDISGKTHVATKTWVLSDAGGNGLAIAEAWCAKCRAKESLHRTGIAFVATAVVAMLFGVCAELVARRLLLRRMKRAGYKPGPFWKWRMGGRYPKAGKRACLECECEDNPYQIWLDEHESAARRAEEGILHYGFGRGMYAPTDKLS